MLIALNSEAEKATHHPRLVVLLTGDRSETTSLTSIGRASRCAEPTMKSQHAFEHC